MKSNSQHTINHNSADDIGSIELLRANYDALADFVDPKQRLMIEKQKLRLLETLERDIRLSVNRGEEENAALIRSNQKSMLKKILSRGFFYFLLLFGLLEDAAGSYLFGSSLIALIPNITNPILMGASLVFTALSCILFYGFEMSILKQALNIPLTNSNLHQLLDTYDKQLKLATAINQRLATLPILTIDNERYTKYLAFTQLINDDLRSKHYALGNYKESIFKKMLKNGVIAFGVLSSIAGSYFMATTLLSMLTIPLLGTPIGWSIILLTITAGLGFFYAMGGSGMARLVNPDYELFHSVKKDLHTFSDEYVDQLEHTITLKDRFQKRPTRDAETQTDETTPPYQKPGTLFFEQPRPITVTERRDYSSLSVNESEADVSRSASYAGFGGGCLL